MDLMEIFRYLHPIVIHFVITGFVLSTLFIYLTIISKIVSKMEPDFLINVSMINFIIGSISYPFAALTGLIDARSVDRVIYTDLLALKMIAGFITITFILITLLLFRSHIRDPHPIQENTGLLIQFTLLNTIILILVTLTATWGGLFVFGHSLFDTFGIGVIIPTSIDQPTDNLFETVFEAVFFSPIMTGLLFVVLVVLLFLQGKLNKRQ